MGNKIFKVALIAVFTSIFMLTLSAYYWGSMVNLGALIDELDTSHSPAHVLFMIFSFLASVFVFGTLFDYAKKRSNDALLIFLGASNLLHLVIATVANVIATPESNVFLSTSVFVGWFVLSSVVYFVEELRNKIHSLLEILNLTNSKESEA